MLVSVDNRKPRTLEELIGPELGARLDRLDVFSRKMLAGALPGERRSKRRGRSVEFDDFRNYVPGDDLRHVDWNVYARFDRLFVKLFREEEDLSLTVAVDLSASMDAGDPNKAVFAARVAMALAYVGLVNQNRVSVAAFGVRGAKGEAGLKQLAPVRGRTNLRRVSAFLLEHLNSPGGEGANLDASLRGIGRMRNSRGIIVVLSDFLSREPFVRGLNALAGGEAGGRDAFCLHVLAPGELDPGREAERGLIGDLRLTDLETGRGTEVTISPASISRYRAGLEKHNALLREACLSRGIAYFLVPSSTAVDQLVLGSLRRGGMLR